MAATLKGLCFLGPQNGSFEELSAWVGKHYPEGHLVKNEEVLQPYIKEITEYLDGKRSRFTIPVDLKGTNFQRTVWAALMEIPYGETKSYWDIANHIQKPAAVRAVGGAIGKNPILITVPCHRVIGKNGKLTGFRGGLEMKKNLLQLEQKYLQRY